VPAGYLKRGRNVIEVRVQEPDAQFRTHVALDRFRKVGSLDRLSRRTAASAAPTAAGLGATRSWAKRDCGWRVFDSAAPPGQRPRGWLESPVIDLATRSRFRPAEAVEIRKARLKVDSKRPPDPLWKSWHERRAPRAGGRRVDALDHAPDGELPASLLGTASSSSGSRSALETARLRRSSGRSGWRRKAGSRANRGPTTDCAFSRP